MKIFALLSSAVFAAPTLNSSLKDMYMLSMMENGNVNPLFMASFLGKNSDSSLWKEYLELNLLTQGQMGSGNFFTANMLNKESFFYIESSDWSRAPSNEHQFENCIRFLLVKLLLVWLRSLLQFICYNKCQGKPTMELFSTQRQIQWQQCTWEALLIALVSTLVSLAKNKLSMNHGKKGTSH